jgi:hypothetical protein
MSKYNVNEAWPIDEPADDEECLKKLVVLSHSGNKIECHGASKLKYNNISALRSKFDIRFSENDDNKKNDEKNKEKKLLESFREKSFPFLPPEARQFIDVVRLKWNTYYNTGTLFIGRHYRLPTRCIDWTIDPFIALFFSCCDDPKEHGVIWWMDYNVFSHAIAMQWPYFYNKYDKIEEDFEKDFTEDKDRDILTRFHYQCLLDRPNKQKAHIILSGQYNIHHDKKIYDLGVRKCGRIVISSNMKFALLEKLNLWGINNTTLGIEDSYVDTIAAKVADEILGKKIEV